VRGRHPNSLRNLRPLQAGQTANPAGINRKRPFSDRYAEMSEARAPVEWIKKINKQFGKPILAEDASWAMLLTARAYLQVYLRGDVNMLREIADRVEGKSPQRLDLTIPAHTEVTLKVVHDVAVPKRKLDPTAIERALFSSIVSIIEAAEDSEDEDFLTAAANLAQMLKARAQQKGKPIDVAPR
jgi:hypothetical protein